LLQEQNHISLSGNHDWAVLGRLDIFSFNADARSAISWTQNILTSDSKAYLEELPTMMVKDSFTLAHASPRHPVWEYILDQNTAAANFPSFETPYCLVGHTHAPVIFEELGENEAQVHLPVYGRPLELNSTRLIINPGSVGQPRDSDPRAAYAILDTEKMTWEHFRVEYDIPAVQERMRKHGLPYRLIVRLEYGW
jgi:diadenosine tetraphosphatase ApaH/serine/threonine PP2A family protein phosphatase